MPTQYIHEPWMAPENVQKSVKCTVGVDYPLPMVNHTMASRINIQRMKQVNSAFLNRKVKKLLLRLVISVI